MARGDALSLSSLPRDWWGYHWTPPRPRSVGELLAAGSLDAQLAALLWLLLEARLPLVVAAGPPLAGKSTTLAALLDFLPADVRRVYLRGRAEDFAWLPEAAELGWEMREGREADGRADLGNVGNGRARAGAMGQRLRGDPSIAPSSSYLLAAELSDHLPIYTWGRRARTLVRAASRGYGVGTTIHAESLAEVLDQLQAPPVGLTDDETRALGVVLVVGLVAPDGGRYAIDPWSPDAERLAFDPSVRRRVLAAHYLRPPERDVGGHVQRRPPAVLATWDPGRDCFEHFAWGVVPELADRTGRSPLEFEREVDRRAAALARLAAEPPSGGSVRAALDAIASAGPDPARVTSYIP